MEIVGTVEDAAGEANELHVTDADIDPDDMDASFFAASVYANGAVWNLESGPLLRREFWEWWLKQAVPLSWNSISGASI